MSDFVHVSRTAEEEEDVLPPTEKPNPLAFLDQHVFVRQAVIDKIYGCVVGSALGDTIGLYTEFLPKEQAAHVYPERKFQLVEPATELNVDGHRAMFASRAWTDDTDQALLILLGYLHARTSTPQLLDNDALAQNFASRLKIWVWQGLLALDRHACGIGATTGSIVRSKEFVSDPFGTATERWVKSRRSIAPNGSLMRTHPIGVIGVSMSEEETWSLSVSIGRTTHVDPRCVVSCCIQVALIRSLLRGEIVDEQGLNACIERSYDWVKQQPALMNPGLDDKLTATEIEAHLERKGFEQHVYASSLDDLKLDEARKIGYVYKCLGSAILLLRLAMRKIADLPASSGPMATQSLFEDLLVDLIMEGGDADTNGAAAGALLGAYLGHAKLPLHWTAGLAHKEWLAEKTGRLVVAVGVVDGELGVVKDEAEDGGVGLRSNDELERKAAELMAEVSRKIYAKKEVDKGKSGKAKKKFASWF
ncbi:ADP-ribosylglycohydrolase [Pyrenochaeta sp. DS3sAY3a]|nr:ADP-ribosylglycohydrolase [Pyrenochaeta sp. DS3sAY3a]